jgi:hypothetical protein
MILKRITLAGALAVAGVTPSAMAQTGLVVPPAGAGAAVAAPTPVYITPAAPAAPRTLWNFLGISRSGHAACKQRLCNSQIGQMMNNAIAPMSAVTGGMIPQFCSSVPTAAEAAALAAGVNNGTVNPAVAAAAAIQAEEAGAKARVAAIEYLGTVDCYYFPEAQEQILNALRGDRNECVRYAAARVLSNGCCCSKKAIDALTVTVMGMAAIDPKKKEEKTGMLLATDAHPAETSERVRCAAMIALQHCLSSVPPDPIEPELVPDPEGLPPDERRVPLPEGMKPNAASLAKTHDSLQRTAYLRALGKKPMASVVRDAERALAIFSNLQEAPFSTGRRTLANAIKQATNAAPSNTAKAPAPAPAPASSPAPSPEMPVESAVLEVNPEDDGGMPAEESLPEPSADSVIEPSVVDPAAPMELPPLPPDMDLEEAPAVKPAEVSPVSEPVVPEIEQHAPSSELLTLPPAVEARRPVAPSRPVARRFTAPRTMARVARPVSNRPIQASYTPAPGSYTNSSSSAVAPGSDYERFARDSSSYRYDPLP